MTPVIRHLPPKSLDCTQSANMTPDEVTRHLDERDRQRHLAQINFVVNLAFVIVAGWLIYVTYQLFTR